MLSSKAGDALAADIFFIKQIVSTGSYFQFRYEVVIILQIHCSEISAGGSYAGFIGNIGVARV
jgi:hypothetical protein